MAGAATTGGDFYTAIPFGLVWIGAALYLVGAFLISIIWFFVNRSEAAGILAGVGIGIVALGATCFTFNM
jgi:membrane protein YdbS with pleckstrin-like domain